GQNRVGRGDGNLDQVGVGLGRDLEVGEVRMHQSGSDALVVLKARWQWDRPLRSGPALMHRAGKFPLESRNQSGPGRGAGKNRVMLEAQRLDYAGRDRAAFKNCALRLVV